MSATPKPGSRGWRMTIRLAGQLIADGGRTHVDDARDLAEDAEYPGVSRRPDGRRRPRSRRSTVDRATPESSARRRCDNPRARRSIASRAPIVTLIRSCSARSGSPTRVGPASPTRATIARGGGTEDRGGLVPESSVGRGVMPAPVSAAAIRFRRCPVRRAWRVWRCGGGAPRARLPASSGAMCGLRMLCRSMGRCIGGRACRPGLCGGLGP